MVIAEKAKVAGAVYGVIALFFFIGFIICLKQDEPNFLVELIIIAAIGLLTKELYDFFTTAQEAIKIDDAKGLVINGKIIVPIAEVKNVSYRKLIGKDFSYNWGSITISTQDSAYTIKNVAACDKVMEKLVATCPNA